MKRLFYVSVVVSCALVLAGGRGNAQDPRPGSNPQGLSFTCSYETIGVPEAREDGRQRLSFAYNLKRLAAAMRLKRGYQVTALPGGKEVRISRMFNGVKYNIIFEGGAPLSFNVNTVNDDEVDPNGLNHLGEKCGTPEHLIRRRIYRMIGDLPLGARQKAELKGYVQVLVVLNPPPSTHHRSRASNNDMHPTADTLALRFRQRCGAADDAGR